MSKIIRPTYPAQFSAGLLMLIYIIAFFLSQQIFDVRIHHLKHNHNVYIGMALAGVASILMILIIWEEFLFPIRVKIVENGLMFRNHRSKLIIQVLMYSCIPAIFAFIYFNYDINPIRFFIWAAVCVFTPVIEKIVSGINNYNDFLRLTTNEIQYKNNEKEGSFQLSDIQTIAIIKDDRDVLQKIQLLFKNNEQIRIDLDEMELEDFYDSIHLFIITKYQDLLG